MKWLMLFIVLCLAVPQAVYAQGDPELEIWPVEQRCIGEPVAAPEGWAFEGAILLTGPSGIHAIEAEWETPRVVAPLDWERTPDHGAGLSPDGQWYAALWGTMTLTNTLSTYAEVQELRVYHTHDDHIVYAVPFAAFYNAAAWQFMYWTEGSDTILVNGGEVVNPLLGEITFDSTFEDFYLQRDTIAPDWSLYLTRDRFAGSESYEWGLVDLSSQELLVTVDLTQDTIIAWSPHSDRFVAERMAEDGISYIHIFDRSGNITAIVYTHGEDEHFAEASWSANGRYLAFVIETRDGYAIRKRLFLADLADQLVIDTCLQIGNGLAFAPNVGQLALLAPGNGQRPVLVLDLTTYQLFHVRNHQAGHFIHFVGGTRYSSLASVIGWRADE